MKAPPTVTVAMYSRLFFSLFSLGFFLISLHFSAARADNFYGRDCGGNCDRLQAGYEWARSEGVTSSDGCTGDDSFVEGCRAFLENNDAAENAAAVGALPDSEPITDQEDYEGSAQGGQDMSDTEPASGVDDLGNYDEVSPDYDYENYDADNPDGGPDGDYQAPEASETPPPAAE